MVVKQPIKCQCGNVEYTLDSENYEKKRNKKKQIWAWNFLQNGIQNFCNLVNPFLSKIALQSQIFDISLRKSIKKGSDT